MAESMNDDQYETEPLTALLDTLPRETVPDRVWDRIMDSRLETAKSHQRRWQLMTAGIAAALMLSIGWQWNQTVPDALPPVATVASPNDETSLLLARNQLLEARLQLLKTQRQVVEAASRAGLQRDRSLLITTDRAIDENLQSESDRPVSELWQQRADILERMIMYYEMAPKGDQI